MITDQEEDEDEQTSVCNETLRCCRERISTLSRKEGTEIYQKCSGKREAVLVIYIVVIIVVDSKNQVQTDSTIETSNNTIRNGTRGWIENEHENHYYHHHHHHPGVLYRSLRTSIPSSPHNREVCATFQQSRKDGRQYSTRRTCNTDDPGVRIPGGTFYSYVVPRDHLDTYGSKRSKVATAAAKIATASDSRHHRTTPKSSRSIQHQKDAGGSPLVHNPIDGRRRAMDAPDQYASKSFAVDGSDMALPPRAITRTVGIQYRFYCNST